MNRHFDIILLYMNRHFDIFLLFMNRHFDIFCCKWIGILISFCCTWIGILISFCCTWIGILISFCCTWIGILTSFALKSELTRQVIPTTKKDHAPLLMNQQNRWKFHYIVLHWLKKKLKAWNFVIFKINNSVSGFISMQIFQIAIFSHCIRIMKC